MASTEFINECKNRANANRLGQLLVDGLEPISNSNNLQKIEIDCGCCVDGKIIGNIYLSKLTADIIGYQNNGGLLDKEISTQVGVKYTDNSTEFVNLGKYIADELKTSETAKNGQIIAYSTLNNKLKNKYISNLNYSQGNITLSDLYRDVCEQLEIIPKTLNFINDNIPITNNPFTNNETNETVLSTISTIACSYVEVDMETNEIDLSWIVDSNEPEYTFEKSDCEITYGPINSVTIKNSQIDDENVTQTDDESITEYGEHSIIISEDYILNTQALREQAITAIFNRLNGFKYVDCKLTTYYGKPFLKVGTKIRIITDDGYFDTYVLNHKFEYDGSFKSIIESPALTEQQIKTKQQSTFFDKVKRTEVIVDKQGHRIEEIIEEQGEQQNQITQVVASINNIQNLFQITGGSNSIKNSMGLLGDEEWEEQDGGVYEKGYDANLIGIVTSVAKRKLKNGKFTTSSTNITNLIIGTQYTFSFYISNDANTTANITLTGNDVIYDETWSSVVNMQKNVFSFIATTSSYTLEITSTTTVTDGYTTIYDIMLNSGDVKPWEPAFAEIYSTVIQLSQMGLQIYCTGSDIATLMTSQGFQIRRFENGNLYEVVTEFTKDGFISKKGVLEELEIDDYEQKAITYQGYKTFILYKKES